MRRLTAYLLMCISVVLGVGVSVIPTFSKVNANLDYQSGRTFVYQLEDKSGSDTDVASDSKAASDVAEIMNDRLETWGVSKYTVKVEGNDTLAVTLSADNDTEYSRIKTYLSYSGEDFSVGTSDDVYSLDYKDVFEGSVARIEYVDLVPVVVFPLKNSDLFKTTIYDNLVAATTDDSGSTQDNAIDCVVWSNRKEDDEYANTSDEDVKSRVFVTMGQGSIYFASSTVEKTEIQFPCGYADANGSFDSTKVSQANSLAIYYRNLFNSTQYKYDCTFLFENNVNADVENLLTYGLTINVATSATLIASLIVFIILSTILVLFYKLGSLAIITSTLSTTFLSLTIFVIFGSEFNVAALLGGILVTAISLFSGIYYLNKFKEEVYRGRSLKKANIEASKKATWPVIDVSVIAIIIGVITYVIGGSLPSSLGTILALGGVANILINTIGLKLLMWVLTSENGLTSRLNLLSIDSKLVPNILKEEKPTYFGPYQDKDFTKKKKPVAISVIAASAISIAAFVAFGIIGNGNIYNSNIADESSKIYLTVSNEYSAITDTSYLKTEILDNILVDGKALDYNSDILYKTREYVDPETDLTTNYEYYVVSLDVLYKGTELSSFENEGIAFDGQTLSDILPSIMSEIDTEAVISLKTSVATNLQPDTGLIVLAALSGLALSAFYLGCRYGLSRGASSFIISGVAGGITLGFFALTRISCTPIVSLSVIGVTLFTLVASLYYFAKEKEIFKEDKTKEKTLEYRKQTMVKSIALAAGPTFIFTALVGYLVINFFGFGPHSFAVLFAANLLGVVISTILIIVILGPLSIFFDGLIIKFKARPRKPKVEKKSHKEHKQKSNEPEEAIFIGIND